VKLLSFVTTESVGVDTTNNEESNEQNAEDVAAAVGCNSD